MSLVAIIDTGMANLASMRRVFTILGAETVVTRNPRLIATAPYVVLPGVGAFGGGMAALRDGMLEATIRERATGSQPLLAVCLGLQLLCEASEEDPRTPGLGVIPGRCVRLGPGVPVPQMGWNAVTPEGEARWLTPGYAAFANSYALAEPPAGWRVATTCYGGPFVAALERGRILACQFHPELSGNWGRDLLERWLRDEVARPGSSVAPSIAPRLTRDEHRMRRIIPCLDVSDGRVVKGVRFQELRDVGDPATHAARYADEGADEIVMLDVRASPARRPTGLETVRRVRAILGIPLTVGGGVRTIGDAERLLDAGADKVAVNTAAVATPELLDALSDRLGAQCTVLAVDARGRATSNAAFVEGRRQASGSLADRARDGAGSGESADGAPAVSAASSWEVLVTGGRQRTERDVIAWIQEGVRRGAGEILLTSWDRDGTRTGCDLALLRAARATVPVPIVASGGIGSVDDAAAAFGTGIDAVLAASIFHHRDLRVAHVKRELAARGIAVRP